MRRAGWNNKTQPSKTIGFYKINCKHCGQQLVFIIDRKTIAAVRHEPIVKKYMKNRELFVAHKVTKKLLCNRFRKP